MEYLVLMGGFLVVLIVIMIMAIASATRNNEAKLLERAAIYKKIKRNFNYKVRNLLTRDTYPCELQWAIDAAFAIEVIFDCAVQEIRNEK